MIYELDKRRTLARMVTRAFGLWRISTRDQLSMLGLSESNRAALSRYRRGEPLGKGRDLLERASHILMIHESLRMLFPRNRNLAYSWMTQRNRAFEGLSPVEVVRDYGFSGLLIVRSYLARQRGN